MNSIALKWPSQVPRILWRHECPLCSSIEFQEADPHPLDFLFKLVALVPVRCANCWRRYYWFPFRKRPAPESKTNRNTAESESVTERLRVMTLPEASDRPAEEKPPATAVK